MKKTQLIIICIFFFQFSFSQNYIPFPTEEAQWNNLFWWYTPDEGSWLKNYHYIQEGDTLINDLVYKKMYYEDIDYGNGKQYIGAIREDGNKQIFFFPTSVYIDTPSGHEFPNNTEEHLLYSFDNLSVGTQIIYPNNNTVFVNEIDSVLMGSSYRKRYNLYSDGVMGDYWIEGVGSTVDLLSAYTYIFEWALWTLCFTDNTDTYYLDSPNGADSCHYYINVGIEDIENSINIYPNPIIDNLNIEIDQDPKNVYYEILNLQGKLMRQGILNDNKSIINLEKLPKGLYILSIKADTYKITRKILKTTS